MIKTFSRGFLCGAGNGNVYVFEKTDDRDYYKKTREIKIRDGQSAIANVALSVSEDSMVIGLENNQLIAMSLTTSELSQVHFHSSFNSSSYVR